jgi:hypothetical protein
MAGTIPATNNLFRGVHHPLSFKRRNVFAVQKFLNFESNESGIETSVVWERYAPTLKYVHAYGCRNSSRRNDRRRAEGRSGSDVYCGAYQFKAGDVRSLFPLPAFPEVTAAEVTHVIEQGEIAHASLHIHLTVGPSGSVEEIKTAVIDRLWRASRGPLRHSCTWDGEVDPHPNTMIPEAPRGPYSDDRSATEYLIFLIRFWLVSLHCRFTTWWGSTPRTCT